MQDIDNLRSLVHGMHQNRHAGHMHSVGPSVDGNLRSYDTLAEVADDADLLLEAARLDGAGELRLFASVVMPLGLPAIASLAIFQCLWVWNDMLIALVFADSSAAPLTVALQSQARQFGSNIDILATGAFLSLVVPLVVFFSFQRYFEQGVLAGSVK